MTSRLDAGLARLVAAGTLNQAQADAVRRELADVPAGAIPQERRPAWLSLIAEVGGYVGAAFVFAAIVALTGPSWDNLTRGTQVSLLAGPAVLMLVAAAGVAAAAPGRWTPSPPAGDGARWRVVSALVVVAGVLLGSAGVVIVDDGSRAELAAAALPALAVGVLGYLACRTSFLHLAVATAAVTSVFGVSELLIDNPATATAPGLATLVLGAAWAALAAGGVLAERTLGLVTGGVIAFIGAETMIVDSGDAARAFGYVALFAIAVAGLGGYMIRRQVAVLAVGAAVLAVAVPQVVLDYSEGTLSAAGALLISGLSIVGASAVGLRVHRT
jgi:hypothetical protein